MYKTGFSGILNGHEVWEKCGENGLGKVGG